MSGRYLIEPWFGQFLVTVRSAVFDPVEAVARRFLRQGNSDLFILLSGASLLVLAGLVTVFKSRALCLIAALVASYRILDLLSHHLHSMCVAVVRPASPVRQVIISMINFVQLGLGFGLIFYAMEVWRPGSFAVTTCRAFGIGDALYLSAVTVTSLGAADMYPVGVLARLATVCELFAGVILIVFIISRHMAFYVEKYRSVDS